MHKGVVVDRVAHWTGPPVTVQEQGRGWCYPGSLRIPFFLRSRGLEVLMEAQQILDSQLPEETGSS